MFEKGEHISYANCGLPYYIGGVIEDREELLVQTVEGMSEERIDFCRAQIRKNQEEARQILEHLYGKIPGSHRTAT